MTHFQPMRSGGWLGAQGCSFEENFCVVGEKSVGSDSGCDIWNCCSWWMAKLGDVKAL